jgi:hypothetical protein
MNIGFKELTCSGGAYAENSQCIFDPHGDFSCFAIPEPEDVHPDSPTTEAEAPRHNEGCTLPACTVCGAYAYEQTMPVRMRMISRHLAVQRLLVAGSSGAVARGRADSVGGGNSRRANSSRLVAWRGDRRP